VNCFTDAIITTENVFVTIGNVELLNGGCGKAPLPLPLHKRGE